MSQNQPLFSPLIFFFLSTFPLSSFLSSNLQTQTKERNPKLF
ncbi:hypothetical protein LINPERHAP1_LOCUS23322 [Linum perenne]